MDGYIDPIEETQRRRILWLCDKVNWQAAELAEHSGLPISRTRTILSPGKPGRPNHIYAGELPRLARTFEIDLAAFAGDDEEAFLRALPASEVLIRRTAWIQDTLKFAFGPAETQAAARAA